MDDLVELSESEFFLLALLWKRSGSGKQYPSSFALEQELKTTRKGLKSSLVELYKKGLITPRDDDLKHFSITCVGARQMESKRKLWSLCDGCEICKRVMLPGINANAPRQPKGKKKAAKRRKAATG